MSREASTRGLAGRVLSAWADIGGSLRWLLAQRPSETALLVFLMISGLCLLLVSIAESALGAEPVTGQELQAMVLSGIAVFGLLWPLFLYLVALGAHGLARAVGGTGSGYESRAAMAWAALVSGPVLVVGSVGGLWLAPVLPPVGTDFVRSLGAFAFVYALCAGFGEVHGFRRILIGLAVVVLAVAGAAAVLA
ncbi:MAG: hypothetical protein ACFBSD_09650 [Paracoccaceae bacterium]